MQPASHVFSLKLLSHSIIAKLTVALASIAWCYVQAATPSIAATTSVQDTINALSRAQAAVVGVQVTAADGARSAETLGQQRRGSGVVIGADGLVLTIGYLILEADEVQITTADKKSVPARVVAYDLATGFGLVRPVVPLRGIQAVSLGGTSDIKTGEPLMAGTGATSDIDADVNMTQLVSKRSFSGYWEYHLDSALFTSPPMQNHSGAPLFNQKGELIGVGSLFVMDAMGQNVRLPGNMFVPVDLLKPIMSEMLQTGSSQMSKRPWVGLTSSDQGGRVQIVRVNKDGPAQAAGLQPGDVVLAVDDAKVANLETFYKKIWDRASPEAEIKLTVLQGADLKTIVLKPVDRMSTVKKPAGI